MAGALLFGDDGPGRSYGLTWKLVDVSCRHFPFEYIVSHAVQSAAPPLHRGDESVKVWSPKAP